MWICITWNDVLNCTHTLHGNILNRLRIHPVVDLTKIAEDVPAVSRLKQA